MRTRREIETEFAPRESLDSIQSFFLVGIGGAGLSGVALMLRNRGFSVAGTDSTASPVTDELSAKGIGVHIGHTGEFLKSGDALVLSDAIDLKTSPEVMRAKELGLNLYRRSQVLGWLLRDKKCICVTGTHGKTTTTGMIGAGLRAAGMDPTIVVGANVQEFGGAIVEGKGEWAVVEACEAYDSLRDFDPYVAVLTNLEMDHVDFHGNWEGLKETVLSFLRRAQPGHIVFNETDPTVDDMLLKEKLPGQEFNEWTFERAAEFKLMPSVPKLSSSGKHNKLNAGAALVAAKATNANLQKLMEGIAGFRGAERRLQLLQEGPIAVVDDYAHHPTEVGASICALRDQYSNRRLIVVFQPHLYSRTADLIPEFAAALSLADHVVLTDIYPAREDPIPGVSSARIAELITKPVDYVPSRHLLPRFVANIVEEGDVVVGMGAGNISEFAPAFIRELDRGVGVPPTSTHSADWEIVGGTPTQRGSAVGETPTPQPKPRVAIIYGGDSAEREISILSGREVQEALKKKGYQTQLIDASELLLSKGDLSIFTGEDRPDVAFLAVHGTNAEDGAIQGLFELLHIPYTGSGVQASAIAMDKQLTKQILSSNGLPTPKGLIVTAQPEGAAQFAKSIAPPMVIKPNQQGSTVGLSFVKTRDEVIPALEKALRYGPALVEEWIEGTEISVPVLGDRALPVVEIVPKSGRYDFASKYVPGATEEIVPARISPELTKKAQEFALTAHRTLNCRGATRTDMIIRGQEIVVLEVNTLPGMTRTSLLPNSARAAGMDFAELCDWIVQEALAQNAQKA